MKVFDLFSGIGGFALGLERAGFETVGFCEIDEYCQKILALHFPGIPIYSDIRELTTAEIGDVDMLCGGFPCQDVSSSGKGMGINAERSGLWSEYHRLITEVSPRYVLIENVLGLLRGGKGEWFKKILFDLASVGYDAEWHCISAAYIGAPHIRDRVWIIAYPAGVRHGNLARYIKRAAAMEKGRNHYTANKQPYVALDKSRIFTYPDSEYPRGYDGLSAELDATRALGNSIIPQIATILGMAIKTMDRAK